MMERDKSENTKKLYFFLTLASREDKAIRLKNRTKDEK